MISVWIERERENLSQATCFGVFLLFDCALSVALCSCCYPFPAWVDCTFALSQNEPTLPSLPLSLLPSVLPSLPFIHSFRPPIAFAGHFFFSQKEEKVTYTVAILDIRCCDIVVLVITWPLFHLVMTHFIIYQVIRIRCYGQSVTVADLRRCLASCMWYASSPITVPKWSSLLLGFPKSTFCSFESVYFFEMEGNAEGLRSLFVSLPFKGKPLSVCSGSHQSNTLFSAHALCKVRLEGEANRPDKYVVDT